LAKLLAGYAGQNLAPRFARASAMLATGALLLTVLASWWLAKEQNDAAVRALMTKEAAVSAVQISTTLRGLAARVAEMADGSLLAAAITDSAGKESYLHPYLASTNHINGMPVALLFTDFSGAELASNSYASFTGADRHWLVRQLQSGHESAIIQAGPNGPELLAVELISPPRTGQPEGALLYKFSLDDVLFSESAQLSWKDKPDTARGRQQISVPIELPPSFADLDFRVLVEPRPISLPLLAGQFALIISLAIAMAAIVLIFGRRLAQSMTFQLRRLETFSSDVVRDGFGSARATIVGQDEVASLARSVNHMLDSLYAQHDQLQQESERRNKLLARYRLLIESTHAISWEMGLPQFQYTFVSPQAERMFGFPLPQWRAPEFWLQHVHGEDIERVQICREQASLNHTDYRCEYRFRHSDGHYLWIEEIGSVVSNPGQAATTLRGIVLDVGLRKAAEKEIQQLAFYDPLTRLPNRRLLLDRLRQMIEAEGSQVRHGAVLFIDLDNFKTLNDTFGHEMGDALLQHVAQRLLAAVRKNDIVARLGGDEFVVMLESVNESLEQVRASAQIVGTKILHALDRPYQMSGHEHHSTASIGVYLFDPKKDTVTDLLQRADLAMYHAKAAGRNTLRFFDPGMQAVLSRRAKLEVDLRRAMRNKEFVLFYQPQVADTGAVLGFEVLLRWQHPERGLVLPAEFIGLAEDTGLIVPIGMWVLEQACDKLVEWAQRPATSQLTLSVNVSVRQFRADNFVEQCLSVLAQTGVNPRLLRLELTESLLVDDVEGTIQKMTRLKETGLSFSLDDFGTGYSSLSYLRKLPLDEIKIDHSFFRNELTEATDAAIVLTIVTLAHSLGLHLIAEGVENERQRDFLVGHGCHAYQGFLYGRAMDSAALTDYLAQHIPALKVISV